MASNGAIAHRVWRRLLVRVGADREAFGLSITIPGIIAVIVLLIVPTALAVWWCLGHGAEESPFRFIWRDTAFQRAVLLSVVYTVATVTGQVVIGVAAAIAVDSARRWSGALAALVFMPYIVPSVLAVFGWRLLLERSGTAAQWLDAAFGIPPGFWMADGILLTVIVVSIWQFYPFTFLAMIIGLRMIPKTIIATAKLDGAVGWNSVRYILLPLLSRQILVVAILRICWMFTKFDTPWLLGGQSVHPDVRVLPVYAAKMGVLVPGTTANGEAAALSGALIVVLLLLLLLLLVGLRRAMSRGRSTGERSVKCPQR